MIWDGVFELHYLENRGAAFGILQGKKIFFVVFTLIVLCLIAYLYLKRIPDEKKFRPMDGICILFLPEHWAILLTVFSAITWSISFILN